MFDKFWIWGISGLVAGALLWLAGLFWFAATIPSSVADTTTRTDAIVVLTGGSERIDTGLKLLTDGLAERLYISGIGGQLRRGDALTTAVKDDALGPRIAIGTAVNTPSNAAETAAWARGQNISSIRLVTAAYHMRRSLLELTAVMPEIAIVPHPVFPPNVKTDWWRWPGTTDLLAREYTKFIVTQVRQWLGIDAEVRTNPPVPRSAPPLSQNAATP